MKTTKAITEAVNGNKELTKSINKVSYYSTEQFINDAKRYINAIKEGRMCCIINSVSRSGMSRKIRFVECGKGKDKYYYMNFFAFFSALGFSRGKDSDLFIINGCGMDMIFNTNYTIIHRLSRLGFLTMDECVKVSQMTPPVL